MSLVSMGCSRDTRRATWGLGRHRPCCCCRHLCLRPMVGFVITVDKLSRTASLALIRQPCSGAAYHQRVMSTSIVLLFTHGGTGRCGHPLRQACCAALRAALAPAQPAVRAQCGRVTLTSVAIIRWAGTLWVLPCCWQLDYTAGVEQVRQQQHVIIWLCRCGSRCWDSCCQRPRTAVLTVSWVLALCITVSCMQAGQGGAVLHQLRQLVRQRLRMSQCGAPPLLGCPCCITAAG